MLTMTAVTAILSAAVYVTGTVTAASKAEAVYRLLGEGPRGNKIKVTVVRETRVRFRLSEL
jgi:hypothetical protein